VRVVERTVDEIIGYERRTGQAPPSGDNETTTPERDDRCSP
jgi:hypothetical protein